MALRISPIWPRVHAIFVAYMERLNSDSCACSHILTTMPFGLFIPLHYDVIKWKHFPRNWSFVRGIHRSPVNSPHTGQWRGVSMFSVIYAWINGWVNRGGAGDLRCYRAHYDDIVMCYSAMIYKMPYRSRLSINVIHAAAVLNSHVLAEPISLI